MQQGFQQVLGRIAAAVVEFSTRHPWTVIALCAVATLASAALAASILEVDTDSDRLLSRDLPVRQTNLALAEVFPDLQNNLVVMIEATAPADAHAAARALRKKLEEEPARFPGLFLPGDAPYYDDFGLYYLDRDELDELALRIDDAGPLLATFVDRPELPILLGALTHTIGDVEGLAALGPDGLRILEQASRAVERFRVGDAAPIDWESLLVDDIGEGHPDRQPLFVRPAGDLTQMAPVLDAIAHIRALAAELEPHPGLRVRVTGDRAVHTEEMSLVITEAIVAGGASLVMVSLLLFYCLRSLRLLLATMLTLVVGLVWTAGLAALLVGGLNALTTAFAVLYIGLGIDFGIHFALGYLEQRRGGRTAPEALRGIGARVGSSLFFCALTTAIGFYAFIPTPYSAVGDMGIISGSGVLLSLIATLTLYPALIALGLGESSKLGQALLQRLEIRLPTFPVRYPRAVCAVAAAATLLSVVALQWVRFDLNTLNVRDPRVESVQALKDLLLDPERSVWTIEGIARDLDEARQLAAQLEGLDGVRRVHTAESFLPEDPDERLALFTRMRDALTTPLALTDDETGSGLDRMKAVEITIEGYGVALDLDADLRGGEGDDDPLVLAAERLRRALDAWLAELGHHPDPARVAALERELFGTLPAAVEGVVDALPTRTVGLADLPDDLRRRYLAPDGRARVEVFSSRNLEAPGALEAFSDLVLGVWPEAGGPAAGTVALGRAIIGALQQALATAVVVIIGLLLVLWRSVRYTLITLAPLVVGTMATVVVSVGLGVHVNFANIIVLPLLLGIGVDSGIHLVHRHRAGLGSSEHLLETSTANAVLFSALTTVASFSTLALSNHLGIASLGQMLSVGIVLMLGANVIVLPAILRVVDARERGPR